MRDYGGNVTQLNRVGEIWVGQVEIPSTIAPGDQLISVKMEDSLGSSAIVQKTTVLGQYHQESDMDEYLQITVMNEPPVFNIGELIVIEIGEEDVEYTLTISVEDYDGLNWVKVKLGILAPVGQSNTWFTMSSNGDGTYSKQITVKTYIALGTHEILVKAEDSYDAQTGEESIPVLLEKPVDAPASADASSTLTYVAIGGLVLLAILGAAVYVFRGTDTEGGLGGFGDA